MIGSTLVLVWLVKLDNATGVRLFQQTPPTRAELNHQSWSNKIIYLNVMDWANVTKIHTRPSAKRYFPHWRLCAEDKFEWEWRAIERHCWDRSDGNVLLKCNLWNRIDAGSTLAFTLEVTRPFVTPTFNLSDATWIRRLPQALKGKWVGSSLSGYLWTLEPFFFNAKLILKNIKYVTNDKSLKERENCQFQFLRGLNNLVLRLRNK